jgi:hypothetical protein
MNSSRACSPVRDAPNFVGPIPDDLTPRRHDAETVGIFCYDAAVASPWVPVPPTPGPRPSPAASQRDARL